jgi:AcrR family transcriptional regulator
VAQIIAEAGLSRASFYHYFASKFEVVVTLMSNIFSEMFEQTHAELEAPWADPGAALRTSLGRGMRTWFDHRAVIQAVLENQHVETALAEVWTAASAPFVNALATQIEAEQRAGRALTGSDPRAVASMLVSAAECIFYVGSTGSEPWLRTAEQRLDAVVAISLAAIYGDPRGPVKRKARALRRPDGVMAQSAAHSMLVAEPGARSSILGGARRLLEDSTLDALSVAQILRAAGVSRGTFYFYFASKEAVFIALFEESMSGALPILEQMLADPQRRRSPNLAAVIALWFEQCAVDRAVFSRAIEEWPRHPLIRSSFLDAQSRLSRAFKRAIDEDRKAAVAVDGIPSATLAAGLVWTMQRAWYEASDQPNREAVYGALAGTVVAAIYGAGSRL